MRRLRGFHHAVLPAVAALVVLACGSAPSTLAPTAQPTVVSTPAPTPAPTATMVPTPTPTTAPTLEPATPEPTAEPTPEPTLEPTPEPTQDAEELLLSYLLPHVAATCEVRDPVYNGELTEVVGVVCGDDDLEVDYSLFESTADMRSAYNQDLSLGESPPVPDGTCPEGNYEGQYGSEGVVQGRLNCREHTSDSGARYHVLEWTNDELLVIGYISNRVDLHDWEDLIAYRATTAGPFPPN